MEKQQLIDYILNSPENTNPAILNQMIDEVGGGGSGDFGTCTGTFIVDSISAGHDVYLSSGVVIQSDSGEIIIGSGTSYSVSPSGENENIILLLYKGKQRIHLSPKQDGDIVSISGNIEQGDFEYEYIVTGDFTVHCIVSHGGVA